MGKLNFLPMAFFVSYSLRAYSTGKSGLSLKKTPHVWLPHTKTKFYCYGVQFLYDDIELGKNLACFHTYGTDV